MALDENVFLAVLAMNSYNRSYNEGIVGLSDAAGPCIGDATIVQRVAAGDTTAVSASF